MVIKNKPLFLFYNVENLYPIDHSAMRLYNWDLYKYQLKIRKIKRVFEWIKEDYNQLPGLIGMAEIGASSVLSDLASNDSVLAGYQWIYQDSQDSGGLSVALLFNPIHFKIIESDFLNFPMDDDISPTRDILYAKLEYQAQKLNIFVIHLPSQRNQDEKRKLRHYILQNLKEKIDDLYYQNEAILIMGDFNENPNHDMVKALAEDQNFTSILSNPFESIFKNGDFSTYHKKTGLGFDQILFTEALLLEKFNLKLNIASIYKPPKLRNPDRKNYHFPFRSYAGSRYIGGYSDHFPVILQFSWGK